MYLPYKKPKYKNLDAAGSKEVKKNRKIFAIMLPYQKDMISLYFVVLLYVGVNEIEKLHFDVVGAINKCQSVVSITFYFCPNCHSSSLITISKKRALKTSTADANFQGILIIYRGSNFTHSLLSLSFRFTVKRDMKALIG